VTLSASSFVPKAETPFQWVGMDRIDNLDRKQHRIAARVRRGVRFKHHRCDTSFLEAAFSRGDRRLGGVLERAWRNGARFDGWDEHFNRVAWNEAFRAEGVDPEFYAYRDLDPAGRLPWDAVDSRVNRKWLAIELRRALAAGTLSVCGPKDCHGCAPFARECVKGVVAETTDRPLDGALPLLSTPSAPGPGLPACAGAAPPLAPRDVRAVDERRREEADRPRYRFRARFGKTGRLRYLGHLDLARLLMRAMRRAGIPLVYSQGFNPKPRVAFGPALSVGVASEAEYLDFESWELLDPEATTARLNDVLPPGVRFDGLRPLRRDAPGLGESIVAARYRVRTGEGHDVREAIEAFRRREGVTVEREDKRGRTKRFDLKREVLDVEALDDGALRLTLSMHNDGASVRPEEALREIVGERASEARLVREELLVDWRGRRVNPLLAASADASRAAS